MNTRIDRYEHAHRPLRDDFSMLFRADALLFSLIIKGITKKKYYLYT